MLSSWKHPGLMIEAKLQSHRILLPHKIVGSFATAMIQLAQYKTFWLDPTIFAGSVMLVFALACKEGKYVEVEN